MRVRAFAQHLRGSWSPARVCITAPSPFVSARAGCAGKRSRITLRTTTSESTLLLASHGMPVSNRRANVRLTMHVLPSSAARPLPRCPRQKGLKAGATRTSTCPPSERATSRPCAIDFVERLPTAASLPPQCLASPSAHARRWDCRLKILSPAHNRRGAQCGLRPSTQLRARRGCLRKPSTRLGSATVLPFSSLNTGRGREPRTVLPSTVCRGLGGHLLPHPSIWLLGKGTCVIMVDMRI